jgi:hypothetical protein
MPGGKAMEPSTELRDLTLRLYEALASGDHAFLDRHFSGRSGVLTIGTDPQEWWTDREAAMRVFRAQLEEIGGFPIAAGDPQAYTEGSVGWVADQPRVTLPGTDMRLRLTGVLHREGEDWKIVQWHISMGVPNEQALGQELTTQ